MEVPAGLCRRLVGTPAQVVGGLFALEDDGLGAMPTTYIGGTDVVDGIRWVGLDVHARESTIAVFDQRTGEVTTRRARGRPHELLERLMEIAVPARMVYEAGPTGYGLARRARAHGIEMLVCAPGRTDRAPTDRVKTDKRDAMAAGRRGADVRDRPLGRARAAARPGALPG
jgi:hypothetical protein